MSDATPASKPCSRCLQEKSLSEFYRRKANKDGRDGRCKVCTKEVRAEANFPEYARRWQRLNRDRLNAYQKQYRKTAKGRWQGRADHLMRRYGLTLEDYDAMATAQNNLCAVCGEPETDVDHRTKRAKRLAVDHDHDTGQVRLLLCARCNGLAGRAKDDPTLLRLLAEYLEAFSDSDK